jgi:hypothetical protein
MTLMDNFMKWFMAPKTLKGIAGMIVIIIVLALDFAYWAGAIDVMDMSGDTGGGGGEVEVELPDNFEESISGNLDHGRKLWALAPMNHPQGEGEGETYNLYPVEILINTSELVITSDGDPGSPPRGDGGDRNDLDLYLFAEGNDAGGNFDSTDPDHTAATATIQEQLTQRNLDAGNWTLRVECFTGDSVSYTIDIQITYSAGNETEEEGE